MTSKQDSNDEARWSADTRRRLLACLFCGLLAAGLWWVPVVGDLLRHMELKTGDAVSMVDTRVRPRQDFVFLGIDAASLRVSGVDEAEVAGSETLRRMRGQYPWDRRVYAEAIDRLADAGARVIILDIVLAQDGSPEQDGALAAAIARHRDKVVLTSAFVPVAMGGERDSVQVVEPAEPFLGPIENETSFGYANFWPLHGDGVIRVAHFNRTINEANGKPAHPDEPVYESIAAVAARKLGVVPPAGPRRFRLGVTDESLAANSYEPLSLVTIFTEKEWEKNYQRGAFFKDKVVIIGPATPMFHDTHLTVGGKIYGAQLHLQVLAALLDDTWYEEVNQTTLAIGALCLFGVLLAMLVAIRYARTLPLSLSAVVFWVMMMGTVMGAMYGWDILLGTLMAGMPFSAGILGAIIWQAMTERARRQALHRHLQRSVSPDVADAIVRAPDGYYRAASGNRRQVTVLFADVRDFTHRSESQDAVELVSQLNEYLGRMVGVIFSHGGTVDKFIGDAIMATWGALDDSDVAGQNKRAVAAAEEMLVSLAELNEGWRKSGKEPFRIGIGIHHGEAIVGEVGSDQRTDFTVMGDTVNLASRIEGMTKVMGLDLLLTHSVVEALPEDGAWQNVGEVRVKGRKNGVVLLTQGSAKDDGRARWDRFLHEFRQGHFAMAAEMLAELSRQDERAGLVSFYQAQIKALTRNPDGSAKECLDWDGVLKMESK